MTSHSLAKSSTPPQATMTTSTRTIRLKRDTASVTDPALLSSSIASVLATGLPISILAIAATNPAAASTLLASEVLSLQQTPATSAAAVSTPSWYRDLPTGVQAYLVSAASSMATSTASSPASSSSPSAAADDAAAYTMSGGAIAGVVLGSAGFVGVMGALFAWRARLGPFGRWARTMPGGEEGYERAASRAVLRREFKGSRLDVDVIVEERGEDGEGGGMEMREGVGRGGKDGKHGKDREAGAEDGVGVRGDEESTVTALPRYRPSILGNAASWTTGWPNVWLSK